MERLKRKTFGGDCSFRDNEYCLFFCDYDTKYRGQASGENRIECMKKCPFDKSKKGKSK